MDLLRALRGKKGKVSGVSTLTFKVFFFCWILDDQQSAVDQAKERAFLLKNISRAIKEASRALSGISS